MSATFNSASPQGSPQGTLNGNTSNQIAGVLNFTDTDSNVFNAFCVEPSQYISYNQVIIYQIVDPTTLKSYDTVARLVGGYLTSNQDANHAVAVQWAIWEIMDETANTMTLDSGTVNLSNPSTVRTIANTYLANVNSYAPANIVYLTSATRQDVVSWNAVPEPASAGLALLSGLLLFRRKRS